jgi:G:T-mismatch repair DNA endonuclease (very short patch repair protein)
MNTLLQEETLLILKYFDLSHKWDNGKLKITLKFKDKFKKSKDIPYKCVDGKKGKQPFTPANLQFYTHYLEESDEIDGLYSARKKLYSMFTLIDWYIETVNPIDGDNMLNYKSTLKTNNSTGLKRHYDSDAGIKTKEKLKKRSKKWANIIGKMNADKWKNANWKKAEMDRRRNCDHYERSSESLKIKYNDTEFKNEFIKKINHSDRINKISKSSKQMWKYAKEKNHDLYYRMCNSAKNKKFENNGIYMNSIEYSIAEVLNSLNLIWEYEKLFVFDTNSYLPDFFIPNKNLIIECYGDFWHANPKIFKKNDTTHKNIIAETVWKRDKNRETTFISNGYKFLNFWESDINNNLDAIKKEIYEITK